MSLQTLLQLQLHVTANTTTAVTSLRSRSVALVRRSWGDGMGNTLKIFSQNSDTEFPWLWVGGRLKFFGLWGDIIFPKTRTLKFPQSTDRWAALWRIYIPPYSMGQGITSVRKYIYQLFSSGNTTSSMMR